MGLQGVGLNGIHRVERATGFHVLRVTVDNAGAWRLWCFTTAEHHHGVFNRMTGEWVLEEEPEHTSPMCEWLFGPAARGREGWGIVCREGRWHVA